MAEKDAHISLCQAWHASDVQSLRARHTAVLATTEDRHQASLAAAFEQQQADAEEAATIVDKLKIQHKLHVRLVRSDKVAECDRAQSNLREAQAKVDRLQQELDAQHHDAQQTPVLLHSEVCSRQDHAAQQEAVC